jgi:hypothetical protein
MSKAFECISFVWFSLLFISVDLYTVYVHPYLRSNIITMIYLIYQQIARSKLIERTDYVLVLFLKTVVFSVKKMGFRFSELPVTVVEFMHIFIHNRSKCSTTGRTVDLLLKQNRVNG